MRSRILAAGDAARAALLAMVVATGAVAIACNRSDSSVGTAGPPPAPAPAPPASDGLVHVRPDSPQSRQIAVAAVGTASLPSDEVIAPGRVGINPNRTARVLLPAAGRIGDVMVRLGDAVEAGQPVVTLESPDADAAIAAYRQSEAQVRQGAAALAKADADARRAEDLYEHRAIAEKDVLGARNDREQARAGLVAARAGLAQARRKLEILGLKPDGGPAARILVRAPINGKVLEINVAPGEYRTDTSAALMTVADLATVWITSDVPEPSIRLIHVGDRVGITLVAYPDAALSGRVTRISDVLDRETRAVKVYIEVPNVGGRFRPDMFATIRHTGPPRPTVVVPVAALVHEYGHAIVFVERGPGAFARREVRVGPRTGDLFPVLEGLREGDRVIVDGAVLLKER